MACWQRGILDLISEQPPLMKQALETSSISSCTFDPWLILKTKMNEYRLKLHFFFQRKGDTSTFVQKNLKRQFLLFKTKFHSRKPYNINFSPSTSTSKFVKNSYWARCTMVIWWDICEWWILSSTFICRARTAKPMLQTSHTINIWKLHMQACSHQFFTKLPLTPSNNPHKLSSYRVMSKAIRR